MDDDDLADLTGLSSSEAKTEAGKLLRLAGHLQQTADALRDERNHRRVLEAENEELRALVGIDAADRLEILRRARAANTQLGAALRDLQAGR